MRATTESAAADAAGDEPAATDATARRLRSRGSSRGSQSSRERKRRGTQPDSAASIADRNGGAGRGGEDEGARERRPISLTSTTGPTPLDEYDVIKAIGKGKFAIVYRARHRATGTYVAIKLVKTADMPEKKRNKCLKEVRLLASLDHSNIIRCFQSFVLDSNLFLVLEWAEAGDLKRQIRKANERSSRFHERLIWSYFSQLADAVAHMHEHRIMHRDLKPANIFLTAQAKVKVGDLGLGRHFSEKTEHVFSKVGTPLYMSPEVLQGGGYDWKSDVWSLGCILYELAVLKSPFKEPGLKLYGLFKKITRGVFEPVPDHYSPVLRELTSRMIDINVARRPTTAQVAAAARHMLLVMNGQAPMPIAALLPHPIVDDTMEEEAMPRERAAKSEPVGGAAHKEGSYDDDDDDDDASATTAGTAGTNDEDGDNASVPSRSPREGAVRSRGGGSRGSSRSGGGGAAASKFEVDGASRGAREPRSRARAQSMSVARGGARASAAASDARAAAYAPGRPTASAAGDGGDGSVAARDAGGAAGGRESATAAERKSQPPAMQQHRGRSTSMPASALAIESAQREIIDRRRRSIDFSFVLMEDVFHKLQVLGFETIPQRPGSSQPALPARPIGRVHFALPFQVLPSSDENPYAVALGGGAAANTRFDEFCALCSTLLDELGHDFDAEEHGGAMAAVRTSTALLVVLQQCGVSTAHTAQLPPTTLARGYGPTVVWVLHFLVDECLRRRDVADERDSTAAAPSAAARRPWGELQRPPPSAEGGPRGGGGGAASDVEDAVEDAVEGRAAERSDQFDASGWTISQTQRRRGAAAAAAKQGAQSESDEWEGDDAPAPEERDSAAAKTGGAADEGALLPLLAPAVAPGVWLAEAQKLAPALRKAERAARRRSAAEWRGRVDVCVSEAETIAKALPSVVRDVQRVRAKLAEECAAVRRGEDALHERVVGAASEGEGEVAELRQRSKSSSERLAALKVAREATDDAVRAVEEDVVQVHECMDARQAAVTDESPLRRIKAALVQLGEESAAMELRVGLSTAALYEAARLQRLSVRRGDRAGDVDASHDEHEGAGDGTFGSRDGKEHDEDEDDEDEGSSSWHDP